MVKSIASAALERDLAGVLGRFPEVAAAWLFGSVARGEARPDSDVDVGIIFRHGSEPRSRHRFLGDLAGQLEQVTRRPVDLVVLESQGPIFRHRVLRDGHRFYEADRDRRIDFESHTSSEYLDYRPTYDIAAGVALEGMQHWLESRK
jgi:uncharacterized protein